MIMKMPVGEIIPGDGGFKYDPFTDSGTRTVKLIPEIPIEEITSVDIIDITDEPEFYYEEMIYGPNQAEVISINLAQSHKRPLSNSEYQDLLDLLARGYHLDTKEPVYDHERAAIGIVVNGNFLKFYGKYQQDPLIESALNTAQTLTKAFAGDVATNIKKISDQLMMTAETVPEKYTEEEKRDLNLKGIAFVIRTFNYPTTNSKEIPQTRSKYSHPLLVSSNDKTIIKEVTKLKSHPMLSFGLIPKRLK